MITIYFINRGVNHSLEIFGNPYEKSEISYAFGRNPFEKREISYAKYTSDFPLAIFCSTPKFLAIISLYQTEIVPP